VLIIFGAGKLPRVAGDIAKGIKNFKSGMKEEPGAVENDDAAEGETKALKSESAEAPAEEAAKEKSEKASG
ncbi:MAG: twin-arginine translocase TatA/TatE family subunit, partial [Rhodospirillales bacterium]|nr:twin-arginine translocase TatA/TatE family subunit [Rhodospirillales bacterium]